MNWRCSSEEFKQVLDSQTHDNLPHRIDSIWYKAKGVCSPTASENSLIIPPLPVKPITRVQIFSYLWTKASEYLYEAEELIICGYSLPDTDRLAGSLFANFRNKNLKQITVVDPDPSIMKKWQNIFNRSNVSIKKWIYSFDFKEYVNSL